MNDLILLGIGAALVYLITNKKTTVMTPEQEKHYKDLYSKPELDTTYPVLTEEQKKAAPPARRDWYKMINPRTGAKYASLTEYLTTPLTDAEIAAMPAMLGGDGAYSRRPL